MCFKKTKRTGEITIYIYIAMHCLGSILLMEMMVDYKVPTGNIVVTALFWPLIAVTTILEILYLKLTGKYK